MNIKDFVAKFTNHPILFVGSGFSMRYSKNSYTWDGLLEKITFDIANDSEHYIDLKNQVYEKDTKNYNMPKLAFLIEKDLNAIAQKEKDGFFKDVNKLFYSTMQDGTHTSRLKIYISKLLTELNYMEDKNTEIIELKKARKNIGSIITTNYDKLIEDIFNFNPLIGNDILLSNPYGSVYKIHGCVSKPDSIIITDSDYEEFNRRYELVRAQLLSLFIHNPIIFIGYSISDVNIQMILETIFTYVSSDDNLAEKIRKNFLLVEYDKGSNNNEVVEHDITIQDVAIRINKIKTDDYISIYKAISNLRLPISAMDIRKVQTIVGDIYKGGDSKNAIKVRITEDLDNLENSDKVLVIGSEHTIKYEFRTISEIMIDYFSIIDENNVQILDLINKQIIQSNQYFPIYAFSLINPEIEKIEELKKIQNNKIDYVISKISEVSKEKDSDIYQIVSDSSLSIVNKVNSIIWNVLEKNIKLEEFRNFLINYDKYIEDKDIESKKTTDYKKLLCIYDICKYSRFEYNGEQVLYN